MWWFLIGMFLQGAAKASYQQLITRKALEGEPIRRFMKTDPVTVSPSVSLGHLVEDYIYKYHFKWNWRISRLYSPLHTGGFYSSYAGSSGNQQGPRDKAPALYGR
jgi:hypothetical protein